MRGIRALSVLMVALGLSGVTMTPAGSAPPGPSVVAERSHPLGVGRRVLSDDVVRPVAGRAGTAARIRKWPGKVIPYYESIPKKWDWSLDQAIAHWNDSGGRIKFVEVPRREAKLVISYGNTGGADGVGTLGYQYRNYVYLSPSYKKADEFDPETRVWVGRLFTHELGHVLGFDHTTGQCALMYPVYDFGQCPPLPLESPGYYNCRWIDKKLVKRFTRMYGGKPKRPPKLCLIEALPPELRGVTFSGGSTEARPVRITWQPPASVRDGTKVFVTVWKGTSCSSAPDRWERRVGVDPKTGSWTDPAFGLGTWCYLVHIENRYGATRPATGQALARYAPMPAAPAVGAPTWDPGNARFAISWTPPDAFTTLHAMRSSGDPTSCPAAYDEFDAEWLDQDETGKWLFYPYSKSECISLFAVTEWGTVSPRTQIITQIPPPTVTPMISGFSPPTAEEPAASATVTLADSLHYRLGIEVLAGACPASPPPDAEWWDGYEDWEATGRWLFYPESSGQQCVMFAAVDSYDQPGPVETRTFTAPP